MGLTCLAVDTPIGCLYLFSNGTALCGVSTVLEEGEGLSCGADPLLEKARRQLHEYFSQRRITFCCPLAIEGTSFQRRIWDLLLEIPYGQTRTYGQIAQGISHPRAVGQALKQNPLPIFIPCHRVVGKKGLVGFGMGLVVKRFLLDLEGKNPPL